MLKAGDWIEIINPKIKIPKGLDKYVKIKTVALDSDNSVWGLLECGIPYSLYENEFRILTPEEVKAKGLDEKSYLVPQEPKDGVKTASQEEVHETKKPYTKFLFVEDGSITIDTMTGIEERNPEIKVILYAKGAQMPRLVDIKESK